MFSKVYRHTDKPQLEKINNTAGSAKDGEDYYFISYTKIIITAEVDSGFSFELVSSADEAKRGGKVKYGVAEYVTLEKK